MKNRKEIAQIESAVVFHQKWANEANRVLQAVLVHMLPNFWKGVKVDQDIVELPAARDTVYKEIKLAWKSRKLLVNVK